MSQQPKIPLPAWAAKHWSPPPAARTLAIWAANGRIRPAPQKIGRTYYVDPDAIFSAPGSPPDMLYPPQEPSETWGPDDLQRLRAIDEVFALEERTEHPGIYFLLLGGALQYIGMSNCVSGRIDRHRYACEIPFSDSRCLIVHDKSWREIFERAYIEHWQPPFNRQFVRRKTQGSQFVLRGLAGQSRGT